MVEHISTADDPRVADYRGVPDPELLRNRRLFVAEGRLVVRRLLGASRFRTRSVLTTPAAHRQLADVLEGRADLAVYIAPPELLQTIAGFTFHRGCLALGERPIPTPAAELYGRPSAHLLLVLEEVGNPDNVGGTFRNAAAFGADAVLLGPGCCDPLYRKAIRTSMGATLAIPFAAVLGWPQALDDIRAHGWTVVGLTPDPQALDITAYWSHGGRPARVALVLGAEGPGLTEAARLGVDVLVRIPIAAAVDSLNVATAAAVALHCFRAAELRPGPAAPPPSDFQFAS